MVRGVSSLPFVDMHSVRIEASVEDVFEAVMKVARGLMKPVPQLLARAWGLDPAFAIATEKAPSEVVLAGRHRFSRYELAFTVERDGDGGARVEAKTSAEFPGVSGAVYRALVIGSGGHAIGVRSMLARIRASCVTHEKRG